MFLFLILKQLAPVHNIMHGAYFYMLRMQNILDLLESSLKIRKKNMKKAKQNYEDMQKLHKMSLASEQNRLWVEHRQHIFKMLKEDNVD